MAHLYLGVHLRELPTLPLIDVSSRLSPVILQEEMWSMTQRESAERYIRLTKSPLVLLDT